MTIIGTTKKIRDSLSDMKQDGESVNDVLVRIIDSVDGYMDDSYDDYRRTNIRVSDEVLTALRCYRSRNGESYSSVIQRMLDVYMEVVNDED